MLRRLLVLAPLIACTRPASPPAPAPAPAPAIHDLEVTRSGEALVERTRGPDADAAIAALGRVGDPAAIRELLALLERGDPRAARALATAAALGGDVGPEAEAKLLALWPTRAPADLATYAEALGHLGAAASLPSLLDALRRGPPDARTAAALALGKLGKRGVEFTDHTRDALARAAVTDDPELALAVAFALVHEPAAKLHAGISRQLETLVRAPDPKTRALAVTALAKPRTAPGRTFDPRELGIHAPLLADPDYRVRAAAVSALLAFSDDASIHSLLTWTLRELASPAATHTVLAILAGLEDMYERTGDPITPEHLQLVAQISADASAAVAKAPASERTRLARIACQARALHARSPDWRPPLACDDLPAHVPAALTAERIGHGLGPAAERRPQLDRLRRDPDPRVRAAAAGAFIGLLRRGVDLPDAWYLEALADRSPAVAGAFAEALAALASDTMFPLRDTLAARTPPFVTDAIRTALVDRARDDLSREPELYTTLTTTISALHAAPAPCTAGLRHSNPAVRAAARTCITTLTGADPGPQLPASPPPRPPHAPQPIKKFRWRLTTNRGVVDIDLDPRAAPWNVASLVALTRAGFYDGLTFHRVVPGFVVQGGDPEGTGWGGPGYTLPSEPSSARFTRGAVGIADAGKDTGGSQFFIMHARAPHLESRYTHVGHVTAGMEIVDTLLIGDTILHAQILP